MADAHAELSCTACRRLKRRCSKELPTCSLCKRVRRQCDYPTPASSPEQQQEGSSRPRSQATGDSSLGADWFNDLTRSFPSTSDRSSAATRQQPRSSGIGAATQRFPAAFYLDSVTSRGLDMQIPTDLLWANVAAFEVNIDQARLIAERYFETAYRWLPIVSRTRLWRLLNGAPSLCGSADFAALLVAMDLLAGSGIMTDANLDESETREEASNIVYTSLKAAISACEQKGQLSTNFLAAHVLTATYEVGKGLYPAAYFTVGSCVRLCHTLGLHSRKYATQLQRRVDTWNATEERRRLWWASIILDRTVSVGFLFRPLAVPTIPANEIIPGDDELWDAGELSVSPVLIMSIESQAKVSPYARICQAAHILGRVCEHVNEHVEPDDVDVHFQEAGLIQRAGEALLQMIRGEMSSAGDSTYQLFSAMALCCSALLSIYGTHSCIEVDAIESKGRNRGARLGMQQKGLDGYRRIASTVFHFANDISVTPIDRISPLVLHCLYEAGCCFAWIYRENAKDDQLESLQGIRALLKLLEPRWAVAGEYLKLLHDTEHYYAGACSG